MTFEKSTLFSWGWQSTRTHLHTSASRNKPDQQNYFKLSICIELCYFLMMPVWRRFHSSSTRMCALLFSLASNIFTSNSIFYIFEMFSITLYVVAETLLKIIPRHVAYIFVLKRHYKIYSMQTNLEIVDHAGVQFVSIPAMPLSVLFTVAAIFKKDPH